MAGLESLDHDISKHYQCNSQGLTHKGYWFQRLALSVYLRKTLAEIKPGLRAATVKGVVSFSENTLKNKGVIKGFFGVIP